VDKGLIFTVVIVPSEHSERLQEGWHQTKCKPENCLMTHHPTTMLFARFPLRGVASSAGTWPWKPR
jgi:hypothetical protein